MRVSLFIEAVAAAVLWLTPFVEAFKMESVLFGERQVYHEGDRYVVLVVDMLHQYPMFCF